MVVVVFILTHKIWNELLFANKYKHAYGDKIQAGCWKVGREEREVTIPLLALLENRQQYLEEILFGNTRYLTTLFDITTC